LTMPGIAHNLQLLQDVLPRKFNAIPRVLGGNLFRGQRLVSLALVRGKLFLLLLDGFALPPARHL